MQGNERGVSQNRIGVIQEVGNTGWGSDRSEGRLMGQTEREGGDRRMARQDGRPDRREGR